jgi:sterol desaturase/sphingolipid hydroxylase (fatty acid hydroxylase superfamily)
MHYLHHRYFNVNYGGGIVPIDKWVGTFYDGSEAGAETLRRLARNRVMRLRGAKERKAI